MYIMGLHPSLFQKITILVEKYPFVMMYTSDAITEKKIISFMNRLSNAFCVTQFKAIYGYVNRMTGLYDKLQL